MPAIVIPDSLTDGRVTLRLLAQADIPAYLAAFHADPEIGRLLGLERDPDHDGLTRRVAQMDVFRDEGRFVELAIAESESNRLVGSLTLHSFDWGNRRGEVGFWIAPGDRRRGFAGAALALVLGWMFGGLDLDRVEMTTTPDNQAVANLAQRSGFTREGVLRARNLERGRRVDVVMFGLLREEWRPSG